MNNLVGKGSMSASTSGVGWKSGDVVPDQFPAGLRVLVVDDDPTCLMILEKMLRTCYYEVTKCNRAERALSLLRENRHGYDIVISDVHMPDMDGFKLLEHIGLEMDLPVIMMSADDGKQVVMKGVTHGACDYLIKPVRIEALRNIWQHVIRKKKTEWKDLEQSGSAEEGGDRHPKQSDDAAYSSSANEASWRSSKRRKDEDEEGEDRDDASNLKKPRVVWSVELHQQFVGAVNQLGIDKAVPKKILELMNVPGLTRENVASHLQKYRLYLRRLSSTSSHTNNLTNSFLGTQEAPYGLSSLSGIDLQTLAATGQLPAQSLATLQASSGVGRSTAKARMPLPVVDQRNLFSFENHKIRFGDSGKQMNLLHGIPTNMEPKQLVNFHHSGQSLGGMPMQVNAAHGGGQGGQSGALLLQMSQQQSRVQMLNESSSNNVSRPPATAGQPIMSNAIAENGRGSGFNSVSQSSSMMNLPLNPLNSSTELQGTTFPLGSTPGMSSLNPKGVYREEVDSEIKGSVGFTPSYDIFIDLNQHKSNDWELHNISLPFNPSQHSMQSNLDVGPSVSGHQGYSSGHRNGYNRDISSVVRPVFSSTDATGHLNGHSNGQHMMSPYFSENSLRVKAERESDQDALFPDQFGQEDLMSALLKQHQGSIGPAENDFDFDGYPLDNISV